MRNVDLKYRARVTDIAGERAAVIDTDIPDDAPEVIRESLARRAVVNAGGVCPCGARAVLPNRETRRRARRDGRVLTVTIEHEPDCPATLPGWEVAR